MKRAKAILIALAIVGVASAFAFSFVNQNAIEVIKKASAALQTGNSQELSKYFTKTVELEILGDENFYSLSQAEILLKDFFAKNSPTKFVVNHQGSKETSSFAIGTLTVKSGSLRVSFFMKTEQDKTLIHQLRIEKNDEESAE